MRVMPGAKITDTMASPISNTTTMNTVRARGESPLRAAPCFARGTVPRDLLDSRRRCGIANCLGVKID